MYTHPIIIIDVDISIVFDQIFHYAYLAFPNCYIQGSPLIERMKDNICNTSQKLDIQRSFQLSEKANSNSIKAGLYAVHKLINTLCVYTVFISSTLNVSSVL